MLRKTLMTVACLALLAGGTILRAQESSEGDAAAFETIAAWSDAGAPDAADNPDAVFYYHYILGSALKPRSSNATYAYDANGCIHVTGGTEIRLQYPVLLPYGAEVKFLRIYYVDTNAADSTLWLTQYDSGVSSTDITSVNSAGTGGYGTSLSPEVSHFFDQGLNYTLNYGWTGITNSTLQICGARIAYYMN